MKKKINQNEWLGVTQHDAKLEGILSLSTSMLLNDGCQHYRKIDGTVCVECYVGGYCNYRKSLREALENNTHILTTRLLTDDEIKALCINTIYFRFEAWGDLNNEIQLTNYVNIAKAFPKTWFGLWTKQFGTLMRYFRNGGRLADNMSLMLSSPFMEREINPDFVERVRQYHPYVGTFTVTKDATRTDINCGNKQCFYCDNSCYGPNPTKVVELEKSVQRKTKRK